MKKNLSCLVIIFSLAGGLLLAQANAVDFYLMDSNTSSVVENNVQYSLTPIRASLLQIKGYAQSEKRVNFNQKIRSSNLELSFSLERSLFEHTFLSGFNYHYDANDLVPEYHPYENRTGFMGYVLGADPVDSLHLEAGIKGYSRREDDRYALHNKLDSQGYEALGLMMYNGAVWGTQSGLSLSLNQKHLDWEYMREATLSAHLDYPGNDLSISNRFALSSRLDSLYVLQSDGIRGFYSLYDSQNRRNLNYLGVAQYSPSDKFQIRVQETHQRRTTGFSANKVRDNADYSNQALLALDLNPWPALKWQNTIRHGYDIKDFVYSENSRHTEARGLSSTLYWEYSPGDSLSAGATLDLQRSIYPDDSHRWDNDLRNIRLRLANTHYWHDRIKLSNSLSWNVIDDIYMKALLSANNKQTNSLGYSPRCSILFGDRLVFSQDYLIRADYIKYIYLPKKSFYRQLLLKYDLLFDSFPYIARSSDLRWMQLPYRNQGQNAWLANLTYSFEINEYADFNSNIQVYEIDFRNQRHQASLLFKHDIESLYYIIQPQFSWGTWVEYGLLLGAAWRFNNNSLVEFSLNPVGEDLQSLDWKTSVSLNLQF